MRKWLYLDRRDSKFSSFPLYPPPHLPIKWSDWWLMGGGRGVMIAASSVQSLLLVGTTVVYSTLLMWLTVCYETNGTVDWLPGAFDVHFPCICSFSILLDSSVLEGYLFTLETVCLYATIKQHTNISSSSYRSCIRMDLRKIDPFVRYYTHTVESCTKWNRFVPNL